MELVGVELAIGLVGDLERREIDAAIELQRLVGAELRELRARMIHLVRALVGWIAGLRDLIWPLDSSLISTPALRRLPNRTTIRP